VCIYKDKGIGILIKAQKSQMSECACPPGINTYKARVITAFLQRHTKG
jgi:hypothetical protein